MGVILPLSRARRNDLATLLELGAIGGLPDAELLARFLARRGDSASEAAFEILVTRHGPMVLGVCRRILGDSHAAADAFQATFLILVGKAGSIRVEGSLGPWLHGVSRRVARRARADIFARQMRVKSLEGLDPPDRSAAPGGVANRELRAVLDQEIARLPVRYRSAMVLCDLQGLTQEQAARKLRCPVGTIQSRLHRARKKLRSGLARRGVAPAALGATTLAAASARAEIPPVLLNTTVAASARFLAGGAPAGTVPNAVGWLVNHHTRSTRMIKLAWGSIGLAAVALGLGLPAASSGGPGQGGPEPKQARRQTPPLKAKPKEPVTGRSVEGTVTTLAGDPVPGASVVIGDDRPGRKPATLKTDEAGRFARPIPDGEVNISAIIYKEGLAPAVWECKFAAAAKSYRGDIRLDVAEPASGVLVDGKGKPVAGARVRIDKYARPLKAPGNDGPDSAPGPLVEYDVRDGLLAGGPLEGLFRATTDRDGRWTLPAAPGPWLKLRATVDGSLMRVEEEAPPAAQDADRSVKEDGFVAAWSNESARLVISPTAKIVGRVTTKMPGVGVAGLKIWFTGSRPPGTDGRDRNRGVPPVFTDEQGRFTIDGLDEGTLNVFVDGPGECEAWTYRAGKDVALTRDSVANLTIELIPGTLVEGTVKTRVGRPVEGVRLGVYGPYRPKTGVASRAVATDATGRYRFRLPSGETDLYVVGGGPHFAVLPDQGSRRTVIIPDGVKTFEVRPIEVEAIVALHGRVVDAKGNPVPGAVLIGVNLPAIDRANLPAVDQSSRRSLIFTPAGIADAKGEFQLAGKHSSAPPGKPATVVIRRPEGPEQEIQATPDDDGSITIKLP